jgi:hypothetical protein
MAVIGECIEHDSFIAPNGYGMTYDIRLKRTSGAHRIAYERAHGPTDLVIDHLCGNKRCINVDHLEAVTNAENTRRGKSAKLDYGKVSRIKKLYKSGKITQTKLANMFGVGQDQISRIINDKRWRIA